jgi:hypothetical protein
VACRNFEALQTVIVEIPTTILHSRTSNFAKGRPKMEDAIQEKEEAKKTGFGTKFLNFLAYGGFIVIIAAIGALVIIVDKLMK